MKRISTLVLALASFFMVSAQDTPENSAVTDTIPATDTTSRADALIEAAQEEQTQRRRTALSQLDLANRSKDHFLLQVGFDGWANIPDTINTKGLARSFNLYFMFDFPFKTNPKLSVGIGAGLGTNNMYFSDTYVDIAGKNGNRLSFQDVSDTTRFKKYKLMTTYLEAPVELRYTAKPETPKKSLKAAIGVKVGTMLAASAKGKTLLNGSGQTINAYTQKEKSKRFFNTTRLSVTGRVGLGNISLYGSYQVNSFIKEGFGPDVRPFSIGLTFSGL